jgi:hypothetical protein
MHIQQAGFTEQTTKFSEINGVWHPQVSVCYENMKHDPTCNGGYDDCNFDQLVGQMGLVCKFVFTVVGEIVDLWVMEVALELGLLQ